MIMRKLSKFLDRPFSISSKFIVFITCFAGLSFLLSLGLFFKHYYNIKNTIYQKLENQSGRIENSFVDAIEYTEHSMNFIARQIVDNNKWNDYQFIKRLLVSYRIPDNRIVEFSTFAWANDKHRFVVSSNRGLHLDQQLYLSDRDYIPETLSHPMEIHLGKPVYGIYSRKYSIPAGYGVVDKNQKYVGAVITSFVVDSLERKFDEMINANGVGFILMQKNGTFVAASPKLDHEEVLQYLRGKIGEIDAQDRGILDGVDIFKDDGFGSIYYNKLKDYPYVIFTIYDNKLERTEIDDAVFNDVILFFLMAAVMSIVLFMLYKSLVRPIIVISEAAKSIAGGNYEVEISRYGSVEMNQLARSILSIKRFVKKENLLKNKLSKANDDLQKVAKSINHDLRSYAAGVSGLANLIIEEDDLKHINKYSRMIIRQSDEIFRMAQELLNMDLSKINLNQVTRTEEFDIRDILQELVLANQDYATKNRVKISLNCQSDIPRITSDIVMIRRIFSNILTNAIKYSNANTEIKLSIKHLSSEARIEVEVADEGIGMTSEQIEMALAGDGAKVDKAGLSKIIDSTGFGLPIVKKLVEDLGAKIEIESKKFEGTKVKISFDLGSFENKESSKEISSQNKEYEGEKGKILICDDQMVNRMVLNRMLQKDGYKVCMVENGKEALELIDSTDFDLIFTDAKMPIMDGITMTKTIRNGSVFKRFSKFSTVPIILMTSNNDENAINEAKEAGVSKYLDKIYDKSEILEVVREFLKKN